MKRKNKNLFYFFTLITVFSICVGYALINTTLNITGNSEVLKNTWDIHFENIQVTTGSVTSVSLPTIDGSELAVDFDVLLNLPGDFYEFTVDVVNAGTIDAMIDSIVKTLELTEEQKKYFNYIVEYQNGLQITSKQLVPANRFVRLKVRVEYKTDITEVDLPTSNQNLSLGFLLNYIQSDKTAVSVKNKGVYDPYRVGALKCFGSECFYVISSTDDTVVMLAKYKLYVGRGYDPFYGNSPSYGDEATGIQEATLGFSDGMSSFSNSSYWSSVSDRYNPPYVYNSNSLIYEYIENYKNYLEDYGLLIEDARLIRLDELLRLGCSFDETGEITNYKECANAPDWVSSTRYWTGSAYSYSYIWAVSLDKNLDMNLYNELSSPGVRPVIVMKKSEIDSKNINIENPLEQLISFRIDDVLYYSEYEMTWKEWVNSEYNEGYYLKGSKIMGSNGYKIADVDKNDVIISWYNYYSDTSENVEEEEKEEEPSVQLISFNINGVTYQAAEGMTWIEWVESKYNVDNFFIGVSVTNVVGTQIADIDVDDVIIPSYNYVYDYSGWE